MVPVSREQRFTAARNVRPFAVVVLWACAACHTVTARAEPVLVVPKSDVTMHLAVGLPPNVQLKPADAWQLVEIDKPEVMIPAQLVTAIAADGAAGAKQGQLVAHVPPREGANGPRRFRLKPAKTGDAQAEFRFEDVSDTSVKLVEGDMPVFVYNHGVITDESVPESDHRRRKGCYVHPMWGLHGEVLTDDFPKDHYHHHGLFWSWKTVEIEGKRYDHWTYRDINTKYVRWILREVGPMAAVLAVENGWFVGDEKVMVERVWLRVYKTAQENRSFDVTIVLIPTDKPITLTGAGGKSYGGLTLRLNVWPRKDAVISVPGRASGEDLVNTPLPWADLSSEFPNAPGRSGAAVFVHPEHPDYPPTWLTRCYGPLCIGWPGVKPRTFQPGKPILLDYRVWIHKTAVKLDQLEQAYRGYTESVKANWE